MARATLSAVLFEIPFWPLSCSTFNTSVISNLCFVFFKECRDVGLFVTLSSVGILAVQLISYCLPGKPTSPVMFVSSFLTKWCRMALRYRLLAFKAGRNLWSFLVDENHYLSVEIQTNYFHCKFHLLMIYITFIPSFNDIFQWERTLRMFKQYSTNYNHTVL